MPGNDSPLWRLATAGMIAGVLALLLTFNYANGFDVSKDTVTLLVTTFVYVAADWLRVVKS